jgi:hypothetical protein
MREKLTMVVGKTEDFEALSIEVGTNRKSLDGSLTLMHREHLSSVDLNSILIDVRTNNTPFFFIGDSAMEAMLLTKEWSDSNE